MELSGCHYAAKFVKPLAQPNLTPSPIGFLGTTLHLSSEEQTVPPTPKELKKEVASWITDTVETDKVSLTADSSVNSDTREIKVSFVDDLVTKWEVFRINGERFQFEYFFLLRQWIQEGKITKGDEIQPSGGIRLTVEDYPGTTDLFGGLTKKETLAKTIKARLALARMKKRLIGQILSGIAMVTFAAGIVFGPRILRILRIKSGQALIQELTTSGSFEKKYPPSELIQRAKNLLKSKEKEGYLPAASLLIEALSSDPNNPEALSSLADIFIETGALTGDTKEYKKAEKLLHFASALVTDSPYLRKSQARLIWRKGKPEEAITLLESSHEQDADMKALLGKISVAKGDFSKATIYLDEAVKQDPTNISYLLELVNLFEQQSKYAEATSYLKKMEVLASDPAPYRDHLKNLYKKAKDFESLESIYRTDIGLKQKEEQNRVELIKLLNSQKKFQEVLEEASIYLNKYAQSAQVDEEIKVIYDNALKSISKLDESSKESSSEPTSKRRRSRRRR